MRIEYGRKGEMGRIERIQAESAIIKGHLRDSMKI